jgi:hypothetical protein
MPVTAPEWLKAHGGDLKPSKDGHTWMVFFFNQPQYLLEPLPAAGKFSCRVSQTVNGKRLEGKGVYTGRDEAVQGGLEDLRNVLGW